MIGGILTLYHYKQHIIITRNHNITEFYQYIQYKFQKLDDMGDINIVSL